MDGGKKFYQRVEANTCKSSLKTAYTVNFVANTAKCSETSLEPKRSSVDDIGLERKIIIS